MIKAEELRIGNYVNYLGKPFIVNSVAKDNNNSLYYISGINTSISTNISFNPIPLTEEILLKCGFSYNHNKEWLYLNEATCFEINSDDSVNFEKAYFKIGTCELIIEHLHELQNLFMFLNKKELEITM